MASATQIWYLGNTAFPRTPIPMEFIHGQIQMPRSLALFCPHCGEIWARRVVLDGNGLVEKWMPLVMYCEASGNKPIYRVLGSILTPWASNEEITSLPMELLIREFLLHYNVEYGSELDNLKTV